MKARRRVVSLLEDLPDLPEDRERKLRESETPEETKARHRRSLLSDLPDLPEDRERKNPDQHDAPAKPDAEPASAKPDAPAAPPEDDPFANADIHWNSEQTTFTIRL